MNYFVGNGGNGGVAVLAALVTVEGIFCKDAVTVIRGIITLATRRNETNFQTRPISGNPVHVGRYFCNQLVLGNREKIHVLRLKKKIPIIDEVTAKQ